MGKNVCGMDQKYKACGLGQVKRIEMIVVCLPDMVIIILPFSRQPLVVLLDRKMNPPGIVADLLVGVDQVCIQVIQDRVLKALCQK